MNLSTNYLGLELDNPLVPSASPLSRNIDTVKMLEDAGAPAIVLFSLFEEEIHHEEEELQHYLESGSDSFAEVSGYFPIPEKTISGADSYLDHIRRLKNAVDIPIIGSLNGVTPGGWINYSKQIQEAGASAIELNIYYIPTNADTSDNAIENLYLESLKDVVSQVTIPVAMKLNPYFTNLPAFCKKVEDNGAKGVVLFNRFYQPDINLEDMEISRLIHLSKSSEILQSMRWIAILRDQLKLDFAASSGVHTAEDVIKLTMAGADITMMASALLKKGPGHLNKVRKKLTKWLEENEYESLAQMRGSMSLNNVPDKDAFTRGNYIKMLNEFKLLK